MAKKKDPIPKVMFKADELSAKFTDFAARAKAWDAGAYKTANDQLYDILDGVFGVYQEIRNDPDCRSAFAIMLKNKATASFQSNTTLEAKVVRVAFTLPDRKRVHIYANVLRYAYEAAVAPGTLPNWIRNVGGVEEVSRNKGTGQTAKSQSKSDTVRASSEFGKAVGTTEIGELPSYLVPDPNGSNPTYSLALVRCVDGVNGTIVWGVNSSTLVDRVLALAGKSVREAEAITQKDNVLKIIAEQKRASIKNATKSMRPRGRLTSSMAA